VEDEFVSGILTDLELTSTTMSGAHLKQQKIGVLEGANIYKPMGFRPDGKER
jgi:hypothetical protein